jgi:hypothetical protein
MPPRALLICAEDTEAAGAACRWALNNVFRDLAAASADAAADAAAEAEGAGADVFHLVYVVKALHPPSEVFHGPPGTSFQFGGGAGGAAGEAAVIAGAQAALEARYLPILREKMARYRVSSAAPLSCQSMQTNQPTTHRHNYRNKTRSCTSSPSAPTRRRTRSSTASCAAPTT